MRSVAEGRVAMREVKVNRNELLVKVTANRAKHINEYEEAVAGYKEAAKESVRKAMERLQQRIEELEEGEVIVLQAVHFNLAVPQNHSKDYDQVIEMLKMSVDDQLTIKADEFACYVMDDWAWKEEFQNVSMMYGAKA